MKKTYFAPETEIVATSSGNLLYQTSVIYGGDGDDLPDDANQGLFDDDEMKGTPNRAGQNELVDKLDNRWNYSKRHK